MFFFSGFCLYACMLVLLGALWHHPSGSKYRVLLVCVGIVFTIPAVLLAFDLLSFLTGSELELSGSALPPDRSSVTVTVDHKTYYGPVFLNGRETIRRSPVESVAEDETFRARLLPHSRLVYSISRRKSAVWEASCGIPPPGASDDWVRVYSINPLAFLLLVFSVCCAAAARFVTGWQSHSFFYLEHR